MNIKHLILNHEFIELNEYLTYNPSPLGEVRRGNATCIV